MPLIIFDLDTDQFLNNRIFDRENAAKFPGESWVPLFFEKAQHKGWKVMTADRYISESPKEPKALMISEMHTSYSDQLFSMGAKPIVMICAESPNVAWKFYHSVNKFVAPFKCFISFGGVKSRICSPTIFTQLYWPNSRRDVCKSNDWENRRNLVMVASNKRRYRVATSKTFVGLRKLVKPALWKYLQTFDPLFRFEDLYQKRLEAIRYFAETNDFQLFGTGWDRPEGLSKRDFQSAKRAGARAVSDKLQSMSFFKFALCFENCVFPGYVTEKIFDCFFSGCIPVYLGAPDITDFIAPDTFIDYRKFSGFAELNDFLHAMSASKAQNYIEAARVFLASNTFEKFTEDYFANHILNILEQDLNCVS